MNKINLFDEGLRRYLSEEQLTTIRRQKIGIGGAGGLGSNVALILTRSGFNHFEVLDKDTIDASNLNRQQYFLKDIGQSKVETLRRRMMDINPEMTITIHQTSWSEETGHLFFKDCGIVVEAFDAVDWKYKFVEFYIGSNERSAVGAGSPRPTKELSRPAYVISGNGMAGLLKKEPMRQRRLGNLFIVGDTVTHAGEDNPPMAPRVTACAAMMTEIVLDLTLGLVV